MSCRVVALFLCLSHAAETHKRFLLNKIDRDLLPMNTSNITEPLSQRHALIAADGTTNSSIRHRAQEQPCDCVANSHAWTATTRRVPKCIFIDLGAADGNSFEYFLNNGYNQLSACPSGGQWEAYLVEANPIFDKSLKALAQKFPLGPHQVHAMPSTAAFSCAAQTSFYVAPDPKNNHWGSSMSEGHPDVVKTGKQKITVPTVNVVQLIAENVIPGDMVILKVDIEGAEYEVVPCLANFSRANLVDKIYLEEHFWFDSGYKNGREKLAVAKTKLRAAGVKIPEYSSNTL